MEEFLLSFDDTCKGLGRVPNSNLLDKGLKNLQRVGKHDVLDTNHAKMN